MMQDLVGNYHHGIYGVCQGAALDTSQYPYKLAAERDQIA